MNEIPDSFNGYLKVGNDTFVYNVSNQIVTLLPAESDRCKRNEIIERIRSNNTESPEYLYGADSNYLIAMLHNSKFIFGGLEINPVIRFATPIIIKALGNTAYFINNMLTQPWQNYYAITFYGGNINALFDPMIAVERPEIDDYLKNDGAREIKMRPWNDYTRSVDFEIFNEKVNLTISVAQTGEKSNKEHRGASLEKLNSFIRLSFESPQHFEKIGFYYKIVKSLVAILTMNNNIFFEVFLSQKDCNNLFFKTAICKIFDHYENYSTRECHNVISLCDIFDYIPNLIESIANNEVDSLLELLPEDNRKVGRISIKNVQDLCTALEVAYSWSEKGKEKDKLIEELKGNIKKTIVEFTKAHAEIDVNKETTISSAFQYLSYTLKQKILTMYSENHEIIDGVIKKWSLPQFNETNVASFVKLRNNKTHSGIVQWDDNVNLYYALHSLVYVCLFKHIKLPEEVVKLIILNVF